MSCSLIASKGVGVPDELVEEELVKKLVVPVEVVVGPPKKLVEGVEFC